MCLSVSKPNDTGIRKEYNSSKNEGMLASLTPYWPIVEHYEGIRLSVETSVFRLVEWRWKQSIHLQLSWQKTGPTSRTDGYGAEASNIVPHHCERVMSTRDIDEQKVNVSGKASSSPAQIQSPADKALPPAEWCHSPSGLASFWESWWQVRSVH